MSSDDKIENNNYTIFLKNPDARGYFTAIGANQKNYLAKRINKTPALAMSIMNDVNKCDNLY